MKLPASVVRHTEHIFDDVIGPETVFIVTMLFFPVFLFLPGLTAVWTAVAAALVLTLLRRGKVLVLPSILVTAGIVLFALLSPFGKVLFQIGSFRITQGALENGLHKSGILAGMVFLSQFAVSPKLHFPGRIGRFLESMFTVFGQLTEKRIPFKPGSIIPSIDGRLCEIWEHRT